MTNARRWKDTRVTTMQPSLPKRFKTTPKPSKDPVFEEWTKWDYEWDELPMSEDHYYYDGDMTYLRDVYIRNGIVPRVSMKDFLTVQRITVPDFTGRIVTVHSVPHNYNNILKFTKLAGIPYRGEGLPNVTLKTLLKLLRPERKDPSKTLRAEITTDQLGKCAKCGTACKLEMDHIHKISTDPLSRNG